MNPKQKLSSAIVFASVFFGSFLGAGISILTSPKTVRALKDRIGGAVGILKESVNERLDNVTVRVIENSTKITRVINITKENKNKYMPKVNPLKYDIKGTLAKKKKIATLGS